MTILDCWETKFIDHLKEPTKKNKTKKKSKITFIQLDDNVGNPAAQFPSGSYFKNEERERKHGPISLAVQLCVHRYTEGRGGDRQLVKGFHPHCLFYMRWR